MSPDPILQLEGISKTFKQNTALVNVSLSIEPGEIHAILGDNGAGKSTLLKILAGLHQAGSYEGRVTVDGRPVSARSPLDAIKAGIGVVPRRPGIFHGLSIAENIAIGRWQSSSSFLMKKEPAREHARRALEAVGLKLDPTGPARGLHPGQERLIMLARALAGCPKVMVLDEPAAFLTTPQELSQLLLAVRALAERDIAVLYMTRRPSEVLQIADRVTVLRDGCTAGTWIRSEFDEAVLMRAMMSERIGDAGYIDHDDLNQPRGWLDSLRSVFTPNRGND